MSLALLDQAASDLGTIVDEVAFVGAATLPLWITDPGAPPVRPTRDVDVIVEVATYRTYHQFQKRLREAGFQDDLEVICRWVHRESALILDAMPIDADVLGFSSVWQRSAFPHSVARTLPSGRDIRAIPPAYLLACKIEAFLDRGDGDYLGSPDFADILSLTDGREEIVGELAAAPQELRSYVATNLMEFLEDERARDGIYGHFLPDPASQERAKSVLLERLRAMRESG